MTFFDKPCSRTRSWDLRWCNSRSIAVRSDPALRHVWSIILRSEPLSSVLTFQVEGPLNYECVTPPCRLKTGKLIHFRSCNLLLFCLAVLMKWRQKQSIMATLFVLQSVHINEFSIVCLWPPPLYQTPHWSGDFQHLV